MKRAALLAFLIAAPSVAQVTPSISCWSETVSGMTTVVFGYTASSDTVIPVSADNYFDPAPLSRDQVTSFTTGTTTDAFRVTVPNAEVATLTWHLLGNFVSLNTAVVPECSMCLCPAGPEGPEGPQGPAGPQGTAGIAGAAGADGAAGSIGVAGNDGPAGPQGIAGVPGIAGIQGLIGPAGADGPAGAAGEAGPQGSTGDAGADGDAGPAGPAGAQGATGADGSPGAAGAIGPVGPRGIDGVEGAPGAAGPAGPAGPAGAIGLRGDTGDPGPAGPRGIAGARGAAGDRGPAGDGGPSGEPGEIGPRGPDGSPGPRGPAGDEGPRGPAGRASIVLARATSAENEGARGRQIELAAPATLLVTGSATVHGGAGGTLVRLEIDGTAAGASWTIGEGMTMSVPLLASRAVAEGTHRIGLVVSEGGTIVSQSLRVAALAGEERTRRRPVGR